MHKGELARLESVGPEAVLKEMASGAHGQPTSPMREEVEAWLRSKQVAASEASSAKHDTREEETLSISRKAVAISERAEARAARANNIAIAAIILSAATAIIAAVIGGYVQ